MSAFDAPTLRGLLGERVVFFERCGSTNREAMRLGREGAPHGTLVVADAQTEGRGRQGRAWRAQPGENLTFSLLLRPRIAPQQAAMLCFAAGAALSEALDLRLKWPNDLLDGRDRKVSGLLAELELRGTALDFVVIGVGVNVNQTTFPEDLPEAGSLAQLRGPQDRAALLAELVPAMLARCALVGTNDAAILDAWRARSATLGREVQVAGQRGRAVAIGEDGALHLDTGEGIAVVLTGDVALLSPRLQPVQGGAPR